MHEQPEMDFCKGAFRLLLGKVLKWNNPPLRTVDYTGLQGMTLSIIEQNISVTCSLSICLMNWSVKKIWRGSSEKQKCNLMQHESFADQMYSIDGIPDKAFRLWLLLQEKAFNLFSNPYVHKHIMYKKSQEAKLVTVF